MSKVKIAQTLARAGLHLGVTTVGRVRKETPVPTPKSTEDSETQVAAPSQNPAPKFRCAGTAPQTRRLREAAHEFRDPEHLPIRFPGPRKVRDFSSETFVSDGGDLTRGG